MTFFEKLNEVLAQQSKSTFSTSEIKKLMFDAYQTKDESVIPSDYCYNRTNHGRKFSSETRLLKYLDRNEYEYLGKNYKYSGPVYHKEKNSAEEQKVGEWFDGVYKPYIQIEGPEVENMEELKEMGSEPKKEVRPSLNQILYGPPGTGKTFHSITEAMRILEPQLFWDALTPTREALKQKFDEYVKTNRVRLVTFHQSFSYEDFVEGIRVSTAKEGDKLAYDIEPGIFKKVCEEAGRRKETEAHLGLNERPRLWKISISDESSRQYCFTHGEARIGWGEIGNLLTTDLTLPELKLGSNDRSTLEIFASEIRIGDVFLCLKSTSTICGVGIVTGDYRYQDQVPNGVRSDYQNVRSVKWVFSQLNFDILSLNKQVGLTLKTVYELGRFTWTELVEALTRQGEVLKEYAHAKDERKPHVLIIDEINRGNISRIFGELITLIEESKREGQPEALSVTLPYSGDEFLVPDNVFIIGTMNTSDRSLTGLDIALRRRFTFIEMQPKPEELAGIEVSSGEVKVSIQTLLEVMNQRIEILLDRDHCLGHAYFMPLKEEQKRTLPELAHIFGQKILPLLQEYFYDDWERIDWVLNSNGMVQQQYQESDIDKLFPASAKGKIQSQSWQINPDAFDDIRNYQAIIGVAQ